MMMKVRALSSEGRMTAMMLTVLPVFTFAMLFLFNPPFFLDVADDPWFVPGLRDADRALRHRLLHHPQDGRFEGLSDDRACRREHRSAHCSCWLLLFAVVAAAAYFVAQAIALRQVDAPPAGRGGPRPRRARQTLGSLRAERRRKRLAQARQLDRAAAASAWSTPRTRRCARS